MLMDVLSDRGYAVHHERRVAEVPVRFDLATGAVTTETRVDQEFVITFGRGLLRQEGQPRVVTPATLVVPSSEPRAAASRGVDDVTDVATASRAVEQGAAVVPRPQSPAEAAPGATPSAAEQWHDEADVSEVVVQNRS